MTNQTRPISLTPGLSPSQIIHRCVMLPDQYICRIGYIDADGTITRRIVSPTGWALRNERFRALCLHREDHRVFHFCRCMSIELIDANSVVMGTLGPPEVVTGSSPVSSPPRLEGEETHIPEPHKSGKP